MEIDKILHRIISGGMPHRTENRDLEINVMMVGGRRCGKTSVLAAMQSCTEQLFESTPFTFGPVLDPDNPAAMDALVKQMDQMRRYFKGRMQDPDFAPDLKPSGGLFPYPFYVRLKDKKSRININFIDYKGEWINRSENLAVLKPNMEKSRILIIAIDTPHLVEAKGIYNEDVNCCRRVTEMVKDTGFADAEKGPGMVLFVPLKCERYYNRGEMDEVTVRVQKEYRALIHHLQQPGSDGKVSQITIAITPILTLGGAEFSYFKRDDNEDIILGSDGTPQTPIYHISDLNKTEPEPRFCERPLFYVLSYTFALAERERGDKRGLQVIVKWLQNNLLQWSSAEDYLKQAKLVNGWLKQEDSEDCILNWGILKW